MHNLCWRIFRLARSRRQNKTKDFSESLTLFESDCKTVHSLLLSRIFIRSLNAWKESRGKWTPAQNERLDWVGGGDRLKIFFLVASPATPTPPPSHSCVLRTCFVRFFFSRVQIEMEAVNSLIWLLFVNTCKLFNRSITFLGSFYKNIFLTGSWLPDSGCSSYQFTDNRLVYKYVFFLQSILSKYLYKRECLNIKSFWNDKQTAGTKENGENDHSRQELNLFPRSINEAEINDRDKKIHSKCLKIIYQTRETVFHRDMFVHTSSCNFTDDVWTKKNFSTFSYKLVQISPIMILVNSGAFLSISSWFCELTELIFVMIPYISSTG